MIPEQIEIPERVALATLEACAKVIEAVGSDVDPALADWLAQHLRDNRTGIVASVTMGERDGD